MQYDQGTAERIAVIQDAFHRYIKAMQEFMVTTESCTLKGWPDRKQAVLNAFRLQNLFKEREQLRFNHLMDTHSAEHSSWKSGVCV